MADDDGDQYSKEYIYAIVDKLAFCAFITAFSTFSFMKTYHTFVRSRYVRKKSIASSMHTNNSFLGFPISPEDPPDKCTKIFFYVKAILNPYLSFNSVLIFIGMISEAYLYGSILFGNLVGIAISYIYSTLLLRFFFYDLDKSIKSPYEYLQKRFRDSVVIRATCAFAAIFFHYSFITLQLLCCAVVFKTVYPELVHLWQSVLILGIYSMFGAYLHGFRQTFKQNFIQFFLYISGVICAIFITFFAHTKNRSPSELWDIAYQFNRLNFFQIDKDLRTKHAILNQTLSLPLPWCVVHLLTVSNFQRYRSAQTRTKSTLLHLLNIPVMFIISIILLFNAIASFVYFFGCDPIANHDITNKNQISSYYLLKSLGERAPSLAGICLASTFCYGIIFHSSGLVYIADSLVKEVLEPFTFFQNLNLTYSNLRIVRFTIILVTGALSIGNAIEFKFIPATTLHIFFVINNSINSPILGLFILAAFNPYANKFGALFAFLTSLAFNIWLALGKLVISPIQSQELPAVVFDCDSNFSFNQTYLDQISNHTTLILASHDLPDFSSIGLLNYLYSISSKWHCLFSFLYVILVGSLISLVYSLISSKSLDCDSDFAEERRIYTCKFRNPFRMRCNLSGRFWRFKPGLVSFQTDVS